MTGVQPLRGPWRIGIDVGGTFTDLTLIDAGNARLVFKVPSTPENPGEGVINVLATVAQSQNFSLAQLLAKCDHIIHGSTVATNTLLEGKGSRVGLLCTEGFRDALEIRRGIRSDVWNHRIPFAPVLVPRYLRIPICERLDKDGQVVKELVGEQVASAASLFIEENVEAVAVCFLHAYANPHHERAARAILRSTLANHNASRWISLSSEVIPMVGEYERCSTTVVNAYLAPTISKYLLQLSERLRQLGLARPLFIQQSNGGVLSIEQAAMRPVSLLLSGPAAGVGALSYYSRTAEAPRLISMEIGGTSTDVMLMNEGEVGAAEHSDIAGYSVSVPAIDIHTIGAGGGTIAAVDDAGMLHVGPRGAGAVPGPACYGRGGKDPTVTDAQLVLGRLRPGSFAGGRVRLDLELATQVVENKLARQLALSVQDAAIGVIRIANQLMAQAVEKVSVHRGVDPRRFMLVACGGAGPMHGSEVARLLGMSELYVPKHSGAFCAFGMLNSDIRQEFVRPVLAILDGNASNRIDAVFAELEQEAAHFLAAEGFPSHRNLLTRQLDLRYAAQQWTIRINLRPQDGPAAIRQTFESEYDRLYGHVQPDGTIEITNLRIVARGKMPEVIAVPEAPQGIALAATESRPVYFESAGSFLDTVVFSPDQMSPGTIINGPVIVEETTTTIVVAPDDKLRVDQFGDYRIRIGGAIPGTARHEH
jgi:N-methylhydantoinase A